MRRIIGLIAAALLCFGLLSGCGTRKARVETIPSAVTATVETTQATVPETTLAETVPTETAASEHSELYIPGLAVEDVILYFDEVCLDAEFYTDGHPEYLQKWVDPICYAVGGSPTEEDLQVLEGFVCWLNSIPGFPGMQKVQSIYESNWQIHFCNAADMKQKMGDAFVNMDGAVTFWYYDNNEIYEAIVCCLSTVEQQLRSSVILEEIYNGLGPVQDTNLRHDSIISADYTQPEMLTEIDELILKLLYHPDMICGMDARECEAVIRQLYW